MRPWSRCLWHFYWHFIEEKKKKHIGSGLFLVIIFNCQALKKVCFVHSGRTAPSSVFRIFPMKPNRVAHSVQCSVDADFALLCPALTYLQKFYKWFFSLVLLLVMPSGQRWRNTKSTCSSSFRQSCCSLFIPLTCFFSCTDSALGKRGVGPRLWHVWAEGTDCCWNSFCSPLIWEFFCQKQTYAGLRRSSSNIKLSEHTANLPSDWETPQAPLFIRVSTCVQTNTAHLLLSAVTAAESVICYRVISLQ